ncbi:unnamed protein product [Soboliphyme baturini]|uniref:C2 domain-containing protein n=1 Tax=Soboliphyme baturini TaxID=241478 RepID=A0A183IPA1_9BILA|nr:unnamed protein product [Soboliphyme baturini]
MEKIGLTYPPSIITDPFEELDSSEEEEDSGKLLISLAYYPKEETLRVTVERGMEIDTSCNCSYFYLKLWLVRNETAEKRKSSIRRRSSSPVFNCHFDFSVQFEELGSLQLVVAVLQFNMDSMNDELGHVFFGSESNRAGFIQWQDMMQNPSTEVKRWHKLIMKWI